MKDSQRKAMFAKKTNWNDASNDERKKILRIAYEDLDFPTKIPNHPSPNLTQRDRLNDIVMFHSDTSFNSLPQKIQTRIQNTPNWKLEELK